MAAASLGSNVPKIYKVGNAKTSLGSNFPKSPKRYQHLWPILKYGVRSGVAGFVAAPCKGILNSSKSRECLLDLGELGHLDRIH